MHGLLLWNKLQIGLKKFLKLEKIEILYHGHESVMTLTVKKLLEYFMKKTC